ncbi:acyl-CoA thioesterase [Xanthobacter sp. TB0139]|uniref:acyl-CoA thioesterase n=1 Tax=Xanthobacter sp. TB0139 TaxID=3459178 RepID=UPI0040390A67
MSQDALPKDTLPNAASASANAKPDAAPARRPRAPLPRLEDFPGRAFDTIRFGDTDKFGHVNNAVFSTFLETGRAMLLMNKEAPIGPEGASFVIVRLAMDFRAELMWPGEVQIGTRVCNIGRSSFGMDQAIFQGERCVATAETVMVMFDTTQRKPMPLEEDTIAALNRFC